MKIEEIPEEAMQDAATCTESFAVSSRTPSEQKPVQEGPSADEGFLSAQVNCGIDLPVHKDNNHGETWLNGVGGYTGGRLRVESPLGQHPPPVIAR